MNPTLEAMRKLAALGGCGHEPAIGAIAAEARQGYYYTRSVLEMLVLNGLVIAVEKVKADDYAPRFRLATAPAQPPAPQREGETPAAYLGRLTGIES